MNLRRRTLKPLYIAHPAAEQGSFGGVGMRFQPSHQSALGCLQPQSGQLKDNASGVLRTEKMTLLLPLSCDVSPGDGIGFTPDQCVFRVTSCARYPMHLCLQLERILP